MLELLCQLSGLGSFEPHDERHKMTVNVAINKDIVLFIGCSCKKFNLFIFYHKILKLSMNIVLSLDF